MKRRKCSSRFFQRDQAGTSGLGYRAALIEADAQAAERGVIAARRAAGLLPPAEEEKDET